VHLTQIYKSNANPKSQFAFDLNSFEHEDPQSMLKTTPPHYSKHVGFLQVFDR